MTEETNKCTACSCDFTDDEGGVHGDFGVLPMSFCPTCLSCMLDMADQLNPREWVGLTDSEYQDILIKHNHGGLLLFYHLVEEKLRQKNTE
jgi:hypothetical protein